LKQRAAGAGQQQQVVREGLEGMMGTELKNKE
jgi:hypothetical protein